MASHVFQCPFQTGLRYHQESTGVSNCRCAIVRVNSWLVANAYHSISEDH
jgi:hypothetical protein